MNNWDEIRTAYHVARVGTVSGAAEVLGVHHATVIRHIDALEKQLGEKLFHRHARGYATTEAGRDLLTVAQTTEDQFAQLANRIRGKGETVSGDLAITSLADISVQMVQSMVDFQDLYPDVTLRFLTGQRLFRLDYGEAHVAVRAGTAPSQPDYVVQPFIDLRHGLYASAGYAAAKGLPESDADLDRHHFVVSDETSSRAPYSQWLQRVTPAPALRFRASDPAAMYQAIGAGAGIGFVSRVAASSQPDLIEVMPPRPEWTVRLWLVTHIDLHRSLKIQRFLSHLKEAALGWPQ
ncbi:LysR family transcriptional regulator (plasmid) [Pseudorhodobacter turbinis]|uniref:LysR family transcriptional regulator n=1 Tax=Pseudorhodobacter turbinis TaxID=2500533 RepID=A0A4P8EHW4_9RHOB|nr:LysR family transcriptional regulator [Pseudorhodobacter turbinis]QCO56731.1 LysR family transcriptional regulator [Pseudorhodobacter turbinis]